MEPFSLTITNLQTLSLIVAIGIAIYEQSRGRTVGNMRPMALLIMLVLVVVAFLR